MAEGLRAEKKNICAGLLAHVDAGKTTLSEAMLYLSGEIKKLGRVDHRDCFLDTHSLERERGITIFSKQARMELEHSMVTLMDTPGHADFAAEAERSMQVLDLGLMVLSASEPVSRYSSMAPSPQRAMCSMSCSRSWPKSTQFPDRRF